MRGVKRKEREIKREATIKADSEGTEFVQLQQELSVLSRIRMTRQRLTLNYQLRQDVTMKKFNLFLSTLVLGS